MLIVKKCLHVQTCCCDATNRNYIPLFIFREGDLRVIRPFVYVREKDLRMFAEQVKANTVDRLEDLKCVSTCRII